MGGKCSFLSGPPVALVLMSSGQGSLEGAWAPTEGWRMGLFRLVRATRSKRVWFRGWRTRRGDDKCSSPMRLVLGQPKGLHRFRVPCESKGGGEKRDVDGRGEHLRSEWNE